MRKWACYAFYLKPEFVEKPHLKKYGLSEYITYSYGYGPKDAFIKAAHIDDSVKFEMVTYKKW